jgi:hypothetical protein
MEEKSFYPSYPMPAKPLGVSKWNRSGSGSITPFSIRKMNRSPFRETIFKTDSSKKDTHTHH